MPHRNEQLPQVSDTSRVVSRLHQMSMTALRALGPPPDLKFEHLAAGLPYRWGKISARKDRPSGEKTNLQNTC